MSTPKGFVLLYLKVFDSYNIEVNTRTNPSLHYIP